MNNAARTIHRWKIHDPNDDRLTEDKQHFLEEEWMDIFDRPIVRDMAIYISSNTYISLRQVYRIAKIHRPNQEEMIINTFLGGQMLQGLLMHILHPADYNLMMIQLKLSSDWMAQIYDPEVEARNGELETYDNDNRLREMDLAD